MIGGLNTAILASIGALDREVEKWHTNVKNDGGDASEQTLKALSEFITTLKQNNIRNKIKRCNLFCGTNLRASLHPIIVGDSDRSIGYLKDKNYGFTNADYSITTGLSALGTNLQETAGKYLETDVFLSSVGMSDDYGQLSFMSALGDVPLSSIGDYMMPLCGGDYMTKSDLSAYIEFNSDKVLKAASPSSFSPGSADGYVKVENVDTVGGFWLANRTSSTNQKLYKNALEFDNSDATADQSAHPIGGYKFRIFGAAVGNEVIQTSIYKLLFYSLGSSLTESEITILNDALTNFNSTLNRI